MANRICGNKARAGGGRPGHLGHETLTRGVANGVMDGMLGAGSPASSSFSSGDENVARTPTLATPPTVSVHCKIAAREITWQIFSRFVENKFLCK